MRQFIGVYLEAKLIAKKYNEINRGPGRLHSVSEETPQLAACQNIWKRLSGKLLLKQSSYVNMLKELSYTLHILI